LTLTKKLGDRKAVWLTDDYEKASHITARESFPLWEKLILEVQYSRKFTIDILKQFKFPELDITGLGRDNADWHIKETKEESPRGNKPI
jgi:hypothetical protein